MSELSTKSGGTVKLASTGRIAQLMKVASPLADVNIRAAVDEYLRLGGQVESYTDSTGYDVIIDDKRYPPKAIFGLALSKLLDTNVLSKHFSGGQGSECFRTLENLGFEISPKPRPSNEEGLILYEKYSRRDVAGMFDPEFPFNDDSGKWSPTEIVTNVPREGDFVFFVTQDQDEDNGHDDYFTEDGALAWKSQKKHTPDHSTIRSLVDHDDLANTIYFFMRRHESEDYTYFGPISFIDWNPETSNPVHFLWKVLNWPLPPQVVDDFKDYIKAAITPGYRPLQLPKLNLKEVIPPKPKKRSSKASQKGNQGNVDWAKREQRNRTLGDAGEEAVIELEKQFLQDNGRSDLAEKVMHIAKQDPSAGYDIRSYCLAGEPKFIEVKTTTLGESAPFYVSRNEVAVSKEHGDKYWIYRLYDFKYSPRTAQFYRINGSVEDKFELVTESYKAFLK